MKDRYIVTLTLITGGPPETTSWSEYGQSGLENAVLTIDWDIKNRHATKGVVHRVLPSGACLAVYERERDDNTNQNALETHIGKQKDRQHPTRVRRRD